jgi:hypothetical protein
MVCSFDAEDAAIVRLYGTAARRRSRARPGADAAGARHGHLKAPRQIIEIDIETTATSCGYGVPVMSFVRDRERADRGRRYKTKT